MSRAETSLSRRCAPASLALLLTAVVTAACGGGGGSSPTGPPVPTVQTVSGVTTSLAVGSCTPSANDFLVADGGSVQVTLNASGDAGGLKVQLCSEGMDNGDCSINFQTIGVGASVSGVRKGDARQVLSFLRLGCTGQGPFVAGPTTFTATVTYQKW